MAKGRRAPRVQRSHRASARVDSGNQLVWDESSWDFGAAFRDREGTFIGRSRGGNLMLALLMLLTLATAAIWMVIASRKLARMTAEANVAQATAALGTAPIAPLPEPVGLAPTVAPEPEGDSEEALVFDLEELDDLDDELDDDELGDDELGDDDLELEDTAEEEAELVEAIATGNVDEARRARRRLRRARRRARRAAAAAAEQTTDESDPIDDYLAPPPSAASSSPAPSAMSGGAWWASAAAQAASQGSPAQVPAPAAPAAPAPAAPAPTPEPAPSAAPAPSMAPSSGNSLDDLMNAVVTLESRQNTMAAASASLPAQPARHDVGRELRNIARRAASCGNGVPGVANASIDFESSGRVQHVRVSGVSGAVESCVSAAVRQARIPAFSRPSFNVRFPFRVQ